MPDTDTLEIIRFAALKPGPKLIVLGAVHGNETCGPNAIGRAVEEFRSGKLRLRRGQVTFVPVANPKAFAQNSREGDRNLNRDLAERAIPQDNEDRIGNVLCPLLREHDVLVDLHSYTGEGEPFCFAGPEDNEGPLEPFAGGDAEWALAIRLGPTLVIHGWLDGYACYLAERERHGFPPLRPTEGVGTTEYMRAQGGYAVTVECSGHADPAGDKVAYRAVVSALAHLGLVDGPALRPTARQAIRITDSLLCEGEGDRVEPGLRTGDAVKAGQTIAHRRDGALVVAPENGFVVFPNPNARPGQQLVYLAVASERPLAP